MKIKKFLGRAVLTALVIYIIWLAWQIIAFKRYESVPASAQEISIESSVSAPPKDTSLEPLASTSNRDALLEPPAYEIEGVYHIHTRFSDGWKTADKIADLAADAGLDFIILTDHGKPNFRTLDAAGWKQGVLVLAGSELSVSRGHLVGLGFERPDVAHPFSQNAETAVHEISALRGFTIIAHPYSKTRWTWGEFVEYSGLEIVDADSMLKRNFIASLPYLPALLIRPELVLLKMIDPPEQTLRKWDELLRRRPLSGYFSADAHFLYGAIFPIFHLHVLLEKPLPAEFQEARQQVFDALLCGNFFSAIEAAAEARGFRFWLQGDTLRASTPYSFAHETVIIQDGKVIFRTRENSLALPLREPGVYRAEVYLRERTPLDQRVPWIISNPISY